MSHKVSSPPTIAPMDVRIPTYRKIDRLTRAAPTSFTREPESMVLDEATEGCVDHGYSSSIRSTSLDTTPSSSSVSPRPTDIYPYAKKLPPLRSASLNKLDGNKLAPISALLAAAAMTTLPSIRDLLLNEPPNPHPTVSTSQLESSSGSESVFSETSSSSSRPGSAHEGSTTVERLTHRVHKLDMHCDSDAELSSDDNKEDEPKLKKTRIASPAPIVVEDEGTKVAKELKARRMVVLRALIIHLNSTFRLQVVKKVAAG